MSDDLKALHDETKRLHKRQLISGSFCDPGCYGRCKVCPDDHMREQDAHILVLDAALLAATGQAEPVLWILRTGHGTKIHEGASPPECGMPELWQPYAHPPAPQPDTCAKCGRPMRHNVPRLGPAGGWVHAESGSNYEAVEKWNRRSLLASRSADDFAAADAELHAAMPPNVSHQVLETMPPLPKEWSAQVVCDKTMAYGVSKVSPQMALAIGIINFLTKYHTASRSEGWQDISTAPKGERVLLYYDNGQHYPTTHSSYFGTILSGEWQNDPEVTILRPTHWAPLPPPPATKEQQT